MPEHADILAGLHGLRQAPIGIAELLAAAGLGLLLAGAIGWLFRLAQTRGENRDLRDRRNSALSRDEPERSSRIAALLQAITLRETPQGGDWRDRAASHFDLDRGLLDRFSEALYRPQDPPDPEPLIQALERSLDQR